MQTEAFRVLQNQSLTLASAQVGSADNECERIGADLRQARLRLGWTIEQVAEFLRIRAPYLSALEDARLADLPGDAYAVAFVRSYAGCLGLDAEAMARRMRAGTKPGNRRQALVFPAPIAERGLPAGALVLVGLVLAVVAYGGWYRLTGTSQHIAEPVPAVPARLAPLADDTPAPAPSAAIASIQPGPTTPPAHPPVLELPTPTTRPSATTPSTAFSPIGLNQAAAMPMPAPTVAAPDTGRVVVRARADSWLQVRDKSGNVLLNRILHPGESWSAPTDKPQLLLTTGNAGGIDLLVDGTAMPALGGNGVVKHDIPLDPDQLKATATSH